MQLIDTIKSSQDATVKFVFGDPAQREIFEVSYVRKGDGKDIIIAKEYLRRAP